MKAPRSPVAAFWPRERGAAYPLPFLSFSPMRPLM